MIRTEPNSSDEPTTPALAVRDIEKSYPGVRALEHVSFDCRAGEIHGLVGENGAGKSTLMRILAGVIQPDAGTIQVKGKPVVLTSPRHAHDFGIAMVYQDTRLVDDLDVAQNILLGREPGSLLLVNRRALEERAGSILRRLGFPLDLRRPVRDLTYRRTADCRDRSSSGNRSLCSDPG